MDLTAPVLSRVQFAFVLALHDPVLDYDRPGGRARFEPCFRALGEGLFVFPLMLLYTAISLSVFRGKVDGAPHGSKMRTGVPLPR
jgi:hypothetical protein